MKVPFLLPPWSPGLQLPTVVVAYIHPRYTVKFRRLSISFRDYELRPFFLRLLSFYW